MVRKYLQFSSLIFDFVFDQENNELINRLKTNVT